MKIKVDQRYRNLIRASLVLLPLTGIVLSFFSLPVEFAVVISILLVVLPTVLGKFVFEYNVIHVMPLPSDDVIQFCIGSSWFSDNLETLDGLGIILIYKYKETAKEAFQMFREWNYGKIIDKHSNITLSAISEGDDKYSILIYPGDRIKSINNTKFFIEDNAGKNSKANIKVVKFYIQLCFDYKNEVLKKKCIQSLPYIKELILNVGYIKNGEIESYSKTGFRLQQFSLKERDSPTLGQLEQTLQWSDLSACQPETFIALSEQVNKKLKMEKTYNN